MLTRRYRPISRTVKDRGYVRLLLSANRKYMSRRLAQQGMTLSDLKHHPRRVIGDISAVAELLVIILMLRDGLN